jgi:hypothetical protein
MSRDFSRARLWRNTQNNKNKLVSCHIAIVIRSLDCKDALTEKICREGVLILVRVSTGYSLPKYWRKKFELVMADIEESEGSKAPQLI